MAFGRFPRPKEASPFSDINVTPMVDVMLVLLVIFILTAPLLTSAIRMDLPQSQAAQAGQAPESISLSLNAQGELFVNDKAVDEATLLARLQDIASRRPDTEVQLRADQTLAYGRVLQVMGTAQQAGLSRIGFVATTTEPGSGSGSGLSSGPMPPAAQGLVPRP
ncbi:MAG: biopolymer transporter ExbD [Betaproteobacteria bacterium]|jgi:biopolymer transport protein TolR|nr:biopolymer transporter ExbD [Burkholderiales bacterium]NBX90036.1 biopolymer transporter ExbD [Betaproteobacteria bacterium]